VRKGNRDWRAESPSRIEPQEMLVGLKAFARSRRTSLFAVLLAAFAMLLHQKTGTDDLVVGISTVNRWSKDAMELVGCFTNLLPARIRLRGITTFDELATQAHATIKRVLAFGRVPLEVILREIDAPLSSGPIFPIWCQFREPLPAITLETDALSLKPLLIERAAILCDLEADLIESDDALECVFAHRAALFETSMISSMMSDYGAILRAILDNSALRMS
jgi:non-ribosomal peptide synthetase component F